MTASPSCLDNFRSGNRAKLGSTSRCHRILWGASCLLIGLVSCTSPRPIVISECSGGSADIVAPTDDQFKVDPYGTFSWPASAGATAYMLTAGVQAGSTDVWTGNYSHELRPSAGWFYATPPPMGLKVFKFVCPVFDNIACP